MMTCVTTSASDSASRRVISHLSVSMVSDISRPIPSNHDARCWPLGNLSSSAGGTLSSREVAFFSSISVSSLMSWASSSVSRAISDPCGTGLGRGESLLGMEHLLLDMNAVSV
jgi:hypothetical protein